MKHLIRMLTFAACLFAGFVSAGLTEWALGSYAPQWWARVLAVLAFVLCLPPALKKRRPARD